MTQVHLKNIMLNETSQKQDYLLGFHLYDISKKVKSRDES